MLAATLLANTPLLASILRSPGISLYLIALGCLLLAPWNDAAVDYFGLVRGPLKDGEYWRIITGHLVHTSWPHFGLNLAGLVLLQQLFATELRPVLWAWGYAFIAAALALCFLAFSRYGIYIGLSGLLHGLFAYAACLAMRRDSLLASGVLLILGVKVVWENLQGPSISIEKLIGMPVAVDSHLYGFAAGVVLGAVMVASAGNRRAG